MNRNRNYRERIYPSYTAIYTPEAVNTDERVLRANGRALLNRLRDWLPMNRNATCLDVACGAGGVLYALGSVGYNNLCGVDYSAQQVSVARKLCSKVVQGDALVYLREHHKHFDLITAFDIIEHLDKEDVLPFLDAIFGALKPGGRLVVQTPNADSPWFGSLRYGDITHELAFTPKNLGRLLQVAGFSDFEARECRPFAHGMKSCVRALLWLAIRAGLVGWNLIETGARGSGVFSRVFIATATKPT